MADPKEFLTNQNRQTSTSLGAPGAAEGELTGLSLDIARRQPLTLAELEKMIDATFSGAEPLRAATEGRALGQLQGTTPFLTPEQTGLLDQSFNPAREQADRDVLRFADTLAGNRGLRLSDTPIGSAALRERSNLASSIAGQRASAGLQLAQGQQQFNESVRQFQSQLQNSAMQNRLALGQVRPVGEGLASSLMNLRGATAPKSESLDSRTNTPSSILGLGAAGLGLSALERLFGGEKGTGGLANVGSGILNFGSSVLGLGGKAISGLGNLFGSEGSGVLDPSITSPVGNFSGESPGLSLGVDTNLGTSGGVAQFKPTLDLTGGYELPSTNALLASRMNQFIPGLMSETGGVTPAAQSFIGGLEGLQTAAPLAAEGALSLGSTAAGFGAADAAIGAGAGTSGAAGSLGMLGTAGAVASVYAVPGIAQFLAPHIKKLMGNDNKRTLEHGQFGSAMIGLFNIATQEGGLDVTLTQDENYQAGDPRRYAFSGPDAGKVNEAILSVGGDPSLAGPVLWSTMMQGRDPYQQYLQNLRDIQNNSFGGE